MTVRERERKKYQKKQNQAYEKTETMERNINTEKEIERKKDKLTRKKR